MSELKAFNSDRIYWAVEQVERVAGDVDELHLDDNQFYLKSEADKVIKEKDKEIARLDDLAHAHNIELLRKENIIAEVKAKLESVQATAYAESVDAGMENRKLKRALWVARAAAAKFWANYWFDVAPSKYIKYDRIGRMEGVEKEFILTKVTKHMTASDWVGLWEKVERLCRNKVEEYK